MKRLKKNIVDFIKSCVKPKFVSSIVVGIEKAGEGKYTLCHRNTIHNVDLTLDVRKSDFEIFDAHAWNPMTSETIQGLSKSLEPQAQYVILRRNAYKHLMGMHEVLHVFYTSSDKERKSMRIKQISEHEWKLAFGGEAPATSSENPS